MASRYADIKTIVATPTNNPSLSTPRLALATVKYPAVPLSSNDIQVITTDGDRLDLLANQFYNDSSLWWVISVANPSLKQNSLLPPVGSQLRIPVLLQDVLNSYYLLNNVFTNR
jgi:nucleoid-associated protein YgaU